MKGIFISIDLTPSTARANDSVVVWGSIITFTKVFAVSFRMEIVSSYFSNSPE